MAKSRPKFYAVRAGRIPGVYNTWAECEQQTKGFPGAKHRSFLTREEAQAWYEAPQAGPQPIFETDANVTLAELAMDVSEHYQPAYLKVYDGPAPDATSGVKREREDDSLGGRESKSAKRETQDPSETDPTDPIFVIVDNDGDENLQKTPAGDAKEEHQPPGEPVLSPQQSKILHMIMGGENVFFTGSAGTGKSVLLRAIIKMFREKEKEVDSKIASQGLSELLENLNAPGMVPSRWKLAVTASTGMAGVNVGGSTVHSWAGVGLAKENANDLYHKVQKSKMSRNRWLSTGALIIDEISMIDGDLLDKLDYIGQMIRKDPRPFGGIQCIFTGDFFQLPPVRAMRFAFEAKCWSHLFSPRNIKSLTRVYRQADTKFIDILESMRRGIVTDENMKLLQSLSRVVEYPDGIEPVTLFSLKADVDRTNVSKLNALPGDAVTYEAWDAPGKNAGGYELTQEQAVKQLNNSTIWPEKLPVKIGAQVMLCTNLGDGMLVNGSTGTVVELITIREALVKGYYFPRPKDQGFNLDVPYPVVAFAQPKYVTKKIPERTIIAGMSVECINAIGGVEATRHQVPLMLAWALTIHKSQGQTLERVKVDVGSAFAEGQVYVAISRAVSLETLEIRNLLRHKIKVSPKVVNWAAPLEAAQKEQEMIDEAEEVARSAHEA
ncbi:hypothetical protein L202_02904 [Cryptococcus amylolentus CBS 6039]|uniref:ATP-dependent DNA helicase n=1 Tax=Cryptococcus amylolentus CBS 6039 TaxID=1295533 RepID=A0A1E3HWN8_9TREE|nr:hypothetical protein L202_02904 [Cryptococcus amylolentus CBS 6039]ODN80748.1 hypothetical protein L202_02904 [Cryptococcus amylolentus CBS 6039]